MWGRPGGASLQRNPLPHLHDKDEGSILPRNPAALLSRGTRHNLSDIAFVEVFDERVVVGVAMPFVLCRRG